MASADSSVSRDRRRAELREFLRSRRARVSPADVGMPDGGGRLRTPGLRREEVAVLAGIGGVLVHVARTIYRLGHAHGGPLAVAQWGQPDASRQDPQA